jgi:hypothetical protein
MISINQTIILEALVQRKASGVMTIKIQVSGRAAGSTPAWRPRLTATSTHICVAEWNGSFSKSV